MIDTLRRFHPVDCEQFDDESLNGICADLVVRILEAARLGGREFGELCLMYEAFTTIRRQRCVLQCETGVKGED